MSAPASGLAFKAREIEEFVDVYFYRRTGWVVAVAARALHLTPNAVSGLAAVAGVIGGALLVDRRYGLAGFAGLVLHGIFDSADGQLARMTKQTSDLGRILDGVAGYLTYIAVYVAIVVGVVDRGGSGWTMSGLAILAAMSNILQAQMYDYHRSTYAQVVVKGEVPHDSIDQAIAGPLRWLIVAYLAIQRRLVGAHSDVERVITRRAVGGVVREDDRQMYRVRFRPLVLWWNQLGDNGRRFAIGVLALLQRVEWFCAFILVPMNILLIVLWRQQQRADREFVDAIDAPDASAA